jgi:hypothetical protein
MNARLTPILITALALLTTGCGQMTMRTWILIDEDHSGGNVGVSLNGGAPTNLDILRLQGGFLARVTMNTSDLPGPMSGQIVLEDVRMAGHVEAPVGRLCTWNDPTGLSGGPLTVDLLGGTTESEMFLDAKAATQITDALAMGDIDFEEEIDFDLGAGLGPLEFLAAFTTGDTSGLFSTTSTITSTIVSGPLTSVFEMNTFVTNGPNPPTFDADLLAFCQARFSTQGMGAGTFYGVNTKSTYFRLQPNDRDARYAEPIDLFEIGAVPGDVLRLDPVGTWSTLLSLRDGPERAMGGVFSRGSALYPGAALNRVAGAIDAGPNVDTWPSIFCFFGQCSDLGGDDIQTDFPITNGISVTVPPDARFLFVAPIDGLRLYSDNTGMGFGVRVEVNPSPAI